MRPTFFTVTEQHLKLLRRMWIGWQDCEFGAPEVDPKRPYGNSDVVGDIIEILGWSGPGEDEHDELHDRFFERASDLHREMEVVLQILVQNLCIEAGTYRFSDQRRWQQITRPL